MTTLAELIDAIQEGNEPAVQKCLLQGINPNEVEDWANVTPLHFAVLYGHRKIVELLLFWGADGRSRDTILRQSPIELNQELNIKHESDFQT